MIAQILRNLKRLTNVCNGIYPCFILFSAISSKEEILFAWTLLLSLILILIEYGSSWCKEYTSESKYSSAIFNFWNWSTTGAKATKEYYESSINDVKMLINEETSVYVTDPEENSSRCLQRMCTIVCEILLYFIIWCAIVLLFYKRDDIIYWFLFLDPVTECIVPVLFVILNSYVTKIFSVLTYCEAWNYEKHKRIADAVKSFAIPLIGLLTYFVLCFEFLFNKEWFRIGNIIKLKANYLCRRDQLGTSLFTLAVSQFVIDIVFSELWYLLRTVFCCKKTYFDFNSYTVNAIIVNMLFYASFPFYPFSTIGYPIVVALLVYYHYFVFRVHSASYKAFQHGIVTLL